MRLIHFFLIFNLHISICFGQKITREQRINAEMLLIKLRNSTDASDKLILSDKILQIDSSYTKAIAFKALAYYAKKDYQEALKFFNLYLAKKPNSSFCVYRSQLKLEIGDTLGALSDIEKAFFLSGYDDIISNQVSQFFGTDKRLRNAVVLAFHDDKCPFVTNNFHAIKRFAVVVFHLSNQKRFE